jgi:hypothetical protein
MGVRVAIDRTPATAGPAEGKGFIAQRVSNRSLEIAWPLMKTYY